MCSYYKSAAHERATHKSESAASNFILIYHHLSDTNDETHATDVLTGVYTCRYRYIGIQIHRYVCTYAMRSRVKPSYFDGKAGGAADLY